MSVAEEQEHNKYDLEENSYYSLDNIMEWIII